ncbi:hypothetical protein H0H92_014025, partial [Tricholoma furcatifolium]
MALDTSSNNSALKSFVKAVSLGTMKINDIEELKQPLKDARDITLGTMDHADKTCDFMDQNEFQSCVERIDASARGIIESMLKYDSMKQGVVSKSTFKKDLAEANLHKMKASSANLYTTNLSACAIKRMGPLVDEQTAIERHEKIRMLAEPLEEAGTTT